MFLSLGWLLAPLGAGLVRGGLAWAVGPWVFPGGLARSSVFCWWARPSVPLGGFRGVSPAWLAGGAGRVLLGLGPALLVGSAAAALGGGFVVCLVVLFRLFFASF